MTAFALLATLLLSQQTEASEQKADQDEVSSGLQQEGVKRARFEEVERGFSVRLPVGMLWYVTGVQSRASANGAVASSPSRRFDPGVLMGIELGYDVHRLFDLAGFFYFGQNAGSPTAVGPRIDLTTYFGGLLAHVSFVATKRFYFGMRAGAGFGVQDNLVDARQTGAAIVAAFSAEYFTKLRHISLALDAGTIIWTSPIAIGVHLTPAIRFTF